MSVWAIVPVKPLSRAKSRLAGALPPEQRQYLATQMLLRTVRLLLPLSHIQGVLVISRDTQALAMVLGYTCGNDVTARDLQRQDGQWARAKGFDTFCPLGPWIETDLDPTQVEVTCLVNGAERQRGSTADLIFPVAQLIAYVTQAMTLEPGDVIMTGTPAGVGPLHAGDEVVVRISGIGELRNAVI